LVFSPLLFDRKQMKIQKRLLKKLHSNNMNMVEGFSSV